MGTAQRIAYAWRSNRLDFGLAKLRGAAPADSELSTEAETREGVVMGTVPYMSPEQVSGRSVDARTDVYSLGVLLYEMASGRRPLTGHTSAELASAILRDAPPALTSVRPDLPASVVQIVSRCLEKDPAARFQSMRELRAALAAVPTETSEDGRTGHGWRRRALGIAAVIAILLGVAYA